MIFSPDMLDKVLLHQKRQTRRPFKGTLPWIPGKTYAVQPGRGKRSVARIKVQRVRLEKVGGLSTADALEEGFENWFGFKAKWEELYGKWDWHQLVWVVEFSLEDCPNDTNGDGDCGRRNCPQCGILFRR
jgi:hypothetical protein